MLGGINRNNSDNQGLFPQTLLPAKVNPNNFYAESSLTDAGETNIQIKQKEGASVWHYVIGIGAIIAVIMYASHKMD
jgi:hypothetical protein